MHLRNIFNYLKICGLFTLIMQFAEAKTVENVTKLNDIQFKNVSNTSGLQHLKFLRELIKKCEDSSQNTTSSKTWQCLKLTSLHLIDDITARDIVPVWRGVQFVRTTNQASVNNFHDEFWKRMDLQYLTWFDRLALSFTRLLSTHRLEINVQQLTESYLQLYEKDTVGTARHRRHKFNMMVTMMFGVTALGSVLVPMGFQLLSVVSGKALLLAKMALLLASINGLKRVANTGLHYGLYHVPGEQYSGYYDRGDVHHPRNVQIPHDGSHPLDMGLHA